jgi:hypothetical protein
MDMGKRLTQAIIALAFVAATGHGNEILDKGDATDTRIGGDGIKPSVAIDSLGQPHASLVSSGLRDVILYHKIGSRWQGTTWNLANNTGLIGTINNSHIEIEPSTDRAWVSGIMYKAGDVPNTGMAILSRRNVSTSPGAIAFKREWVLRRRGWPLGNVAVDPGIPNRGIVYASGGEWQELIASGDSITSGSGYGIFMDVAGGERTTFAISKAAPVSHPGNNGAPGGSHAVWHAAIGGHQSFWPSYYQNSTMSSKAVWLDPHHYTSQLEEWNYPSVCADSEDGRIGYMAGYELDNHSEGLLINVWNGTRMVRDPKNLIRFDGNMETRRYGPQMAAASGGGVWVTYSRGGWIYLQYVSQDGRPGGENKICIGTQAAIADDGKGGLHMVYLYNGTRYRKLSVSGSAGVTHTDYDGDGKSDLVAFGVVTNGPDVGKGIWYIHMSGGDSLSGLFFGNTKSTPIDGDFNGDGKTDLAVFNNDGWWFISQDLGRTAKSYRFGDANSVPVAADFDGDGATDIGVYQTVSNGTYKAGTWFIYSPASRLGRKIHWGDADYLPAAADFDGDGFADPAAYNPTTGQWHVLYSSSATARRSFIWGNSGAIFAAGDYNADGAIDLTAVVPGAASPTRSWYSCDHRDMGNPHSNIAFGDNTATPVIGDWDGDGVIDRATCENGQWNIKKSSDDSTWAPRYGADWTAPLSQFHGRVR